MEVSATSTKPASRGPNWIPQEDRMLAKAWLTVSNDGITGIDQSGPEFWDRVTCTYNETRPRRHDRYARPQNSITKRWKIIRLSVGKFCGCVAAVKQLNQSGKTDEDRLEDAITMYEDDQGTPFEFLEAWRELNSAPKWKALPDASSNVRARKNLPSSASSSGTDAAKQCAGPISQTKPIRPDGVKSQKGTRSLEASNQMIANAAIDMAKTSKRKADLEELRISVLKEREQNRIIFAKFDGLDEVSVRILRLKKRKLSEQFEEPSNEPDAGDTDLQNSSAANNVLCEESTSDL